MFHLNHFFQPLTMNGLLPLAPRMIPIPNVEYGFRNYTVPHFRTFEFRGAGHHLRVLNNPHIPCEYTQVSLISSLLTWLFIIVIVNKIIIIFLLIVERIPILRLWKCILDLLHHV